jgi:hypothetical protein
MRRGAVLLAFAPVAIISAMVLGLELGGPIVEGWAQPISSTSRATNELVPAITGAVGDPGESFFSRELTLSYASGRVVLSGPTVSRPFALDDEIEITVMKPDGTTSTWTRPLTTDCGTSASFAPLDVTHLFGVGQNTVTVVLYDRCGERRGQSGPLVLSSQG